jgi:hypothetical protein
MTSIGVMLPVTPPYTPHRTVPHRAHRTSPSRPSASQSQSHAQSLSSVRAAGRIEGARSRRFGVAYRRGSARCRQTDRRRGRTHNKRSNTVSDQAPEALYHRANRRGGSASVPGLSLANGFDHLFDAPSNGLGLRSLRHEFQAFGSQFGV